MTSKKITIVLATYNGELFLEEQIKSIQSQTIVGWQLFVRDDGSTDNTVAIIEKLAAEDSRIQLVSVASQKPLGPVGNFAFLIEHVFKLSPDFIAFADQDDIWFNDKLERQLLAMNRIEHDIGKHCPILVFSDLELINGENQKIHASFMNYQHIHQPGTAGLSTLLVQNHIVGCTMMANRALLETAYPLPKGAYMHDWWFGLCAKACGHLEYLSKPTMQYRIHGKNAVGAAGFNLALNPFHAKWYKTFKKMNKLFVWSMGQWHCLYYRMVDRLSDLENSEAVVQNISFVKQLLTITELPAWKRIALLFRNNLACQNRLLTTLLYVQMTYPPLVKHAKNHIVDCSEH